MKHPDLFGGETLVVEGKPKGWPEVKRLRNYRMAEDKAESCKTCAHLVCKHFSKRYYKCELMKPESATPSSDVRLRDTCDLWKKKQQKDGAK